METSIIKLVTKKHLRTTIFAIVVLLILTGAGFTQSTPSKKDCDKEKKASEAKSRRKKKVAPKPRYGKPPTKVRGAGTSYSYPVAIATRAVPLGWTSSEKSLAVYSKVYINLCVLRGKVKINGWKRSELRAFVDRGTPIGFVVRERTKSKNKKPALVSVLGFDSKSESGRPVRISKCLSGKTIELDVPYNATISIESELGETTVDSVRAVRVKHLRGNIYLNNVRSRVDARTYGGNITIKNSWGRIYASTTTGYIVGYKTKTNEVGDYFKAKTTSGSITLQSVGQREVQTNSSSGPIKYVGRMKSGGRYRFTSTRGVISLAIPSNTSCQIEAFYGKGFSSEIPIRDLRKGTAGIATYLTGRMGKGSCQLIFNSLYGHIRIQSLKEKKEEVARFQ